MTSFRDFALGPKDKLKTRKVKLSIAFAEEKNMVQVELKVKLSLQTAKVECQPSYDVARLRTREAAKQLTVAAAMAAAEAEVSGDFDPDWVAKDIGRFLAEAKPRR